MKKLALALLALLLAAPPVAAQNPNFPSTMPPSTVYGRSAISAGPGQAIPFATLFGLLFGGTSPTAHGVLIGEGSSPLNSLVLPDAQIPWGQTGADPVAHAFSGDFTCLDTGACTIGAGVVSSAKIGTNVVGLTNLFQPGANTTLCNPTGSTANWQACTAGQMGANLCAPNIQVFTSGTAATYTVPTCNGVLASYLELEMAGGGGSGGGSGTGGGAGNVGNSSTFVFNSVTYTAGGGGAGAAGTGAAPGAGGTASGCDDNIPGGAGGAGWLGSAGIQVLGAIGGASIYGGTGAPGTNAAAGGTGATNTGSGGGAAGVSTAQVGASGGGAGSTCRKLIVVGAVTTGTYTVGAASIAGTGAGNGFNGGGGAAGRLKVVARWQ